MPPNQKKYEEAILCLCQGLGGTIKGKKKLAKLLYFADFDFYELNGEPITGDTYYALPMGPFPTNLDTITSSMKAGGKLAVDSIEEFGPGYIRTEVYRRTDSADAFPHLSNQERRMIERTAKKYGALTGKQLEDLSHQEAPYIAVYASTGPQQEIPYELAYYRGTDFSDV